MQWKGKSTSTNVEDHRGQRSGGVGGGIGGLAGLLGGLLGATSSGGSTRKGCGLSGILGIVAIIAVIYLLGGNPLKYIGLLTGDTSGIPTTQETVIVDDGQTIDEEFVSVVLKSTEDVWTEQFKKMGRTYRKPTLVIFSGYDQSGCGAAQSATGPFYCPDDEKIYVDISFFNDMKTQLRAGGDFAYAYVIAHEVGHHVQKLLGTLEKANKDRSTGANSTSVRVELQADFYAGLWAHYSKDYFELSSEDIDEALNAANQIGDDRLQEKAQGHAVPDSFTHGTSKQRHDWFYKGYETGDIKRGDTFSATSL
jgi:predicted metalloprotease